MNEAKGSIAIGTSANQAKSTNKGQELKQDGIQRASKTSGM